MQLAFFVYLSLLLILGILSHQKIKTYKDFTLAGANQSTFNVSLSLLATMIGGSATFGMLALVQNKGFPALWWLGSGAFFLVLQARFLAKPVRKLNAYSLPHLANIVINPTASVYIASIICITWIGIIASQFIALEYLLTLIMPQVSLDFSIGIVAIFVIIYTLLGGQYSIFKTDALQFLILFFTVLSIFILIYFTTYFNQNLAFEWQSSQAIFADLSSKFELFNESFGFSDFIYIFLIVGLSYFVGPDIFSRNLAAKDSKTAQKSTYIAAFFLLVFAIMMIYIALWVNQNLGTNGNALIVLIKDYLPLPLAILLSLGLISALISSADTCLMSTATIISNDILKSKSISKLRLIILTVGIMALALAIYKNNIISLLLSAYAVYVPGVVIPLGLALFLHEKIQPNTNILMLGIIVGSGLGLLATIIKMPNLSLYGLGLSAFLSILAYRKSKAVTELSASA